jgi:hypothetical protein
VTRGEVIGEGEAAGRVPTRGNAASLRETSVA